MQRVNRPVPAEESAYPKSIWGAVGLTLLFVLFPGMLLTAISTLYLDGDQGFALLATLAIVMGGICVRLYNAREPRGVYRSMIASVLPVLICGAFAPVVIVGTPLSLLGGIVMYAFIAEPSNPSAHTHTN